MPATYVDGEVAEAVGRSAEPAPDRPLLVQSTRSQYKHPFRTKRRVRRSDARVVHTPSEPGGVTRPLKGEGRNVDGEVAEAVGRSPEPAPDRPLLVLDPLALVLPFRFLHLRTGRL